jgi:hypothetical protein
MRILKSDRKILIDVLQGTYIHNSLNFLSNDDFPEKGILDDDLYLLWDSDPVLINRLPAIIVVSDGHLRDFLAWAVTYWSNFRPFTAYFRVLEFTSLCSIKSWLNKPSLNGIESACIGLIIAESHILFNTMEKSLPMSVANCSNTLSFILSRALALGASSKQIDNIYERWLLIRKNTAQPERILSAKEIRNIYQVLIDLSLRKEEYNKKDLLNENIFKACLEIKNDGRISYSTWHILTENIDILNIAHQQLAATREEKVLYFQKILEECVIEKINDKYVRSFIYGYLASMIAPGSFTHIDLLTKFLTSSPTVILWYGLCAGLQTKNELLSLYQGLGRRLLREILRHEPLLQPPICDLNFEELQILMEGSNNLVNLPSFLINRIAVEIYPCISTDIRWIKDEKKGPSDISSKQEAFGLQKKLFYDLGNCLEQALNIHRKLIAPEQRKNSIPKRAPQKQKRKQTKDLFSKD